MRFRALRGFGGLAGSSMVALALDDDSGPVALPLFSDLIGCACRGSSPVKVSSVALEPGAISSEGLGVFLGRCCRSTDEKSFEVHPSPCRRALVRIYIIAIWSKYVMAPMR